jgi:hypothetical protein
MLNSVVKWLPPGSVFTRLWKLRVMLILLKRLKANMTELERVEHARSLSTATGIVHKLILKIT